MTIGDVIRDSRKTLGLTLEDVGKAVGVDRATVMRWEKGQIQKMGRDKISALASVLNIDPVLFVRPAEVLTDDELRLITAYRAASHEAQGYAMDMLEKSANERKQKETDFFSARTA